MIFNWKKIGGIIAIVAAFTIFGIAHAQTIPDVTSYDSSINQGDFDLEVTPENPSAFDTVTIRVTSSLVDTNRYPIIWTVDGLVVSSGIGKRTIALKMKDYGQTISVVFKIQLVDSTVEKRITLTPQDTTMLWEAVDSYVPPFYPGKKLPAYESVVRIAALPNFLSDKKSSGIKNAVYNWSRSKSVIQNAGGYAKDSILILHNRIRPTEFIEVDASSTSGSATAHAQVTVPFFDPKIIFFQRDPVTGLRSPLATNSFYFDSETTTIEAIPLFFSAINRNPSSLTYDWRMNSKAVSLSDPTKKNIITLKKPDASGSAKLELSVENTTKLFQSAKGTLSILFRK